MSDGKPDKKPARLSSEVRHMKLERSPTPGESEMAAIPESLLPGTTTATSHEDVKSPHKLASKSTTKSTSQSPIKGERDTQSPAVKPDVEERVGGEITVKMEPGKAPKLSRSSSQKIISRPPPLFLDHADSTPEATSVFQVIDDCIYANRYMGSTEHALECDCAEEWDPTTKKNQACGEDSDCINRATKMECIGDCGCGTDCQNQRFQRRDYAKVSVIKTEKKGYGLRTDTNLRPHDFIFEYIGEVIGEAAFRRRTRQYDDENIKHFYFMSLTKGEFVDATKKGNLGRFCNHSCNPNCYVDKWVVGDKLRMGIFAERNIKAGEELVFNYNVDRYGANPQPCYCGEPNCTGFIGGKTQTERATKLSHDTIEALGIEDGDDWDTAVAKKPRKRKTGEDDEEYVDSVQPKSLGEDGVTKVMATLMQCKEKWIAVKLLSRIQRCDDEKVRNRVVKMHGYRILKTALSNFIDDVNVCLQVFDILFKLPRITRNKIQDSKIEDTVESLKTNEDERVSSKATEILNIWSQLEIGYRIPRMKRDPNATAPTCRVDRFDRREPAAERQKSRSRSRSRSVEAPRGPSAPGARSGRGGFFGGPRPPFRRPPPNALPAGWFTAATPNGQTYYYSASGQTTWQRPTVPAAQAPPPPPPKALTHQQELEKIIKGITQEAAQKKQGAATSTPQQPPEAVVKPKKEKQEKWKSLPEEKQRKIYENTLFPHIKHVVDKFKGKLPKEDLKRLAKELSKKLVSSDYKNDRVQDPTQISHKQEKAVKKYAADFFNKAYAKKKEHDKKRAERKASASGQASTPQPNAEKGISPSAEKSTPLSNEKIMAEIDAEMGDSPADEEHTTPSPTSSQASTGTKRKREQEETPDAAYLGDPGSGSPKKLKFDTPPPPPPPPPPPAEDMEIDTTDDQVDTSGSATADNVDDSFNTEVLNSGQVELSMATEARCSPRQLATPPTNGSVNKVNGIYVQTRTNGVPSEKLEETQPNDRR